MTDYDILIVGAGVIGTSLVLALSHLPLSIALVERAPFPAVPTTTSSSKPIALNYASVRILQALIPWSGLSQYANPIKTVHISEQGCFAAARIKATEMDVPELGYVVPAAQLSYVCTQALLQLAQLDGSTRIKKLRVDVFNPAQCHAVIEHADGWEAHIITEPEKKSSSLLARLLVIADGSDSVLRDHLAIGIQKRDQQNQVLVSTLNLACHHGHVAYQRFSSAGVLACLPMVANTVGLAWTTMPGQIQALRALDESDFLAQFQDAFSCRLGKILSSGPRHSHPINSFMATTQARPGLLLLGNAAHTFSPIAAQGLNLALQDMAEWSDILTDAYHAKKDLAHPSLSQAYLSARSSAQRRVWGFTEHLSDWFSSRFTPLAWIRNSGLLVFDRLSFLKRPVSRRLMGIHGRLASLARHSVSGYN